MIESVFAITNAPTKSAIPANASRMYCRKAMSNCFLSSLTWAFASRTTADGGSNGWISEISFGVETPAFDWMRITSSWPGFAKIFCAVGRSKSANVAPPIEPTPDSSAIPERRNVRCGPTACSRTVSPTAKPSREAVALSTATSSPPLGQEPAVSFVGLNCCSRGSTEKPSDGAPPVSTTFPSLPMIFTLSLVTEPAAAATSGTFFTSASTLCGKVGVSTPFPFVFLKAASPLITTSAFLYEFVTIVLKPLLIVSVRM